jgi:small subunit ribosomal protein S1
MASDPWEGDIPSKYKPGMVCKGKVTKITNFGVFVELEPGLEGLLHVSELADDKVDSPEDVVKIGDEIEVKVLRLEVKERKIGLSRKNLYDGRGEDDSGPESQPVRERETRRELRGGTGQAGPLFQLPGQEEKR